MKDSKSAPVWFFVVAILAIAWNGIGVVAYVAEAMQTPEQLAQLSEAQRELYTSKPSWVTAAFAIAVFGGLFASIALIAKKPLAIPLFAISIAGLIGQNSYYFLIAKVQNTMDSSNFIMPVVVFIIAIALLFFSRSCNAKGWLS